MTEEDRETLRDPKFGTDLRREVRKSGHTLVLEIEKAQEQEQRETTGFGPCAVGQLGRVVEGEGVDFRGRGGWGRQRGTCWLTPEVSRVSTARLWKKEREHCSQSAVCSSFGKWM